MKQDILEALAKILNEEELAEFVQLVDATNREITERNLISRATPDTARGLKNEPTLTERLGKVDMDKAARQHSQKSAPIRVTYRPSAPSPATSALLDNANQRAKTRPVADLSAQEIQDSLFPLAKIARENAARRERGL